MRALGFWAGAIMFVSPRRTLQQFGLDWTPSEGKELSADDADAVLGMTLPATLAGMVRAHSILASHGRSPALPSEPAISEKTADAVVRMLVAAVDHGTGRRAKLSGVAVAGKTATVVSRREPFREVMAQSLAVLDHAAR